MNLKHLSIASFLLLLTSCNSTKQLEPSTSIPVVVQPSTQVPPTTTVEVKQEIPTAKPVNEPTFEQAKISDAENMQSQKAEKTDSYESIELKYAALHDTAEQEYKQSRIIDNEKYMNGEITYGQLEYATESNRISKLEKQIEYKKMLVQELQQNVSNN